MTDTEKTEIYTTEYIDKDLPKIIYEKKIVHNMTESESVFITISDKTSKAALDTFKELRKEVEVEEIKHEHACSRCVKPGGIEPGTTISRWNIL
jgi:hypothetical protein